MCAVRLDTKKNVMKVMKQLSLLKKVKVHLYISPTNLFIFLVNLTYQFRINTLPKFVNCTLKSKLCNLRLGMDLARSRKSQ